MTFPSSEKSPEDLFNFDTQIVDKFTHRDKSILLSDMGKQNSTSLLATNDLKINGKQPNLKNIIFNKLYDEDAFMQSNSDNQLLCHITFDPLTCPKTEPQSEHFEHINQPIAKIAVHHPHLLFAENQGYDMLPSSDKPMYTESFSQDDHELKSEKMDQHKICDAYQQLSDSDLLNFAKQIATGMVSNKIISKISHILNECSDEYLVGIGRNFWPVIKLSIVIWLPGMFSFVQINQ